MKKEEILSIRKKILNLSQDEFSRLLSVSTRTVMRWENGNNIPQGSALDTLKLLKMGLKDEKVLKLVKEAIEYGNIHLVAMFIKTLGSIQGLLEPKLRKDLTNDFIKVFKKHFHY